MNTVINMRIFTLVILIILPRITLAQDGALPEEIQVIGERSVQQLRLQMWDSEKAAYEIFNEFNDDERFTIHCRLHEPTGSLIKRQVCTTEFEIEASSMHAQDFLSDMCRSRCFGGGPSNSYNINRAEMVARQQQEYKAKIREVAEEHPEFLQAVIRFTEIKQRYENETRTGGE